MPDDVTERLAALERRLDRLEAILVPPRAMPAVPPPRPPPPLLLPPVAPPRTVVAPPRRSLEQAIGLRWAAWVGAIAVVIGAGLGIDFAYHHGWFDFVSPTVRVGLLVMAAAALIGVGEVVYRRVNPWSAVGPFAAGVAVLFLAAYAGYALYGLYGRGPAFALMALATVVGAAVARRGDLVSIAAVAIVGGNLAPALLHAGLPQPAGFLTYLLTLQIVAVVLAFRGGPKWWVLRGLSLATTAAWVAVVIAQPPFAGSVTIACVVAYAVVYHAERIASAAAAGVDDEPAGSVAFGLCVTAALAAGVLFLTRSDSTAFCTGEVLAMATVAAAVAAACGRGGVALRAVAVSFVVQAIGLVALAVPVATSGPWVVVGWELLAVAVAVGGRWSTAGARAAPFVWALAAFDLLLWADGLIGQGHAVTVLTLAGAAVRSYVVVAWSTAAGGHVVAELTRRRRLPQGAELAGTVDGLSAATWVAASMIGLPSGGATAAVVVYAGVTTLAGLTTVGAAAAVFAAIKWMATDTVLRRPSTGATWGTASLGVAIVAVLVAVGWVNRRRGRAAQRRAWGAARVFAVVVGVWAATVVLDAAMGSATVLAEQVATSILWAASATAVVAAGFGRRLPDLRYAGLGLFAVTLLKVVAVDLSGVGAGWRILSFLGLGGLLIATSVLYGRLGGAATEQS